MEINQENPTVRGRLFSVPAVFSCTKQKKWPRTFFTIFLLFFFLDTVSSYAQEVDLDLFLNDSTQVDVTNLSNSLSYGLGSAYIQNIQALRPYQVNISINNSWVFVQAQQRYGPLSDISSFHFPLLQLEVGLPSGIHIIGRGTLLKFGAKKQERAFLWGAGFRYSMLEKLGSYNGGVLLVYEELRNLQDFDLRMLNFEAYLGVHLFSLNLYVSTGMTRSLFDIHLNNSPDMEKDYNDLKISVLFKLSVGFQYYLSDRIMLKSSYAYADYSVLSIGTSVTFF